MKCLTINFPQSKDCGPIEGAWLPTSMISTRIFPQSKDCGPIEGPRLGQSAKIIKAFPQSKDCGPIEGDKIAADIDKESNLSAVERLRPH